MSHLSALALSLIVLGIGSSGWAAPAGATPAPLTDQLLSTLLAQHTPDKVFEQGQNPWPGGNFKLEVFKNGSPQVTTGDARIHVQVPLKIVIAGSASNSLLRIQLACDASFTTLAEVVFTPKTSTPDLALNSEITLPIPPVMADCGGTQLPMDEYLKALVDQKKPQWESQIDDEVDKWLRPE